MLVWAVFVLALTELTFASQSINAAQFALKSSNAAYDVRGKFRRSAEEKGCLLPSPLKHGRYKPSPRRCNPQSSSPYCRMVAGSRVPEKTPLYYECDPGYDLYTPEQTSMACKHGQWMPELPSCVESHYESENQNLPHFQNSYSLCGKPAQHLRIKRGVDGTVSEKGSWPWMVILGMRKNNSQSGEFHWFCAGTLVTPHHILTAAQCVADYRGRTMFFARFNDIDLDSKSDDKGAIEIEIHKNNVAVHPGFKRDQVFSHNLAIIRMNSELQITDYVRPVCLPTPDFTNRTFENKITHFISWGQTDNDREWSRKRGNLNTKGGIIVNGNKNAVKILSINIEAELRMQLATVEGRHQLILHEHRATVVNHYECNDHYRNYQSDDFIIVEWDLICASVPVNKSCQGDAGSPLLLKIKDTFVLIGIVATSGCHNELFPRLFTSLSKYMEWVISHLKM